MMNTIVAVILLHCFLGGVAMAAQQERLPNIVYIMADDLGYGSLGCYGADPALVRTPAIDSLAAGGMRFLDASTPSSICSPTRYGVLFGRYPWRTKMKYGVVNVNDPLLPDPSRTSLAAYLKGKGYTTAAIGKWHLGYGSQYKNSPKDWTKSLSPGPLDLGFDYHFAVPQNHGDITGVFVENDRIYGLESDQVFPYSRCFYGAPYLGFDAPQRVNKETMSVLTDKAVQWLEGVEESPFFLFFTPVAVHHPITPSDEMRGESGCGPYGDFIQDLDRCVERILGALDKMGVREETLLVFTSDNGGDIPPGAERPEGAAKALGLCSNGAWRGDKHTIWEGGVRVPLIVQWPGRIEAGGASHAMVNLLDSFATIVEAIEGAPPRSNNVAPDSISFYSALIQEKLDKSAARKSMAVTNAQGIFALRQGDWKYIEGKLPESWPSDKRRSNFNGQAARQLYDLANDPQEKDNLLASHPEVAKELQRELDAIRK